MALDERKERQYRNVGSRDARTGRYRGRASKRPSS